MLLLKCLHKIRVRITDTVVVHGVEMKCKIWPVHTDEGSSKSVNQGSTPKQCCFDTAELYITSESCQ